MASQWETQDCGAIRVLYDWRAKPPLVQGDISRWLRKKLFGTLTIKRFDGRMINLNGRTLVTVGIKLFY